MPGRQVNEVLRNEPPADYAVDTLERNDQGYLVTLEIEENTLSSFRLYPMLIQDYQARRWL